jgi:hypothetical protein
MRLFGRFRCASANSRSAISLVAPASARAGPGGQRPRAWSGFGFQFPADQLCNLGDGDPRHQFGSPYGHRRLRHHAIRRSRCSLSSCGIIAPHVFNGRPRVRRLESPSNGPGPLAPPKRTGCACEVPTRSWAAPSRRTFSMPAGGCRVRTRIRRASEQLSRLSRDQWFESSPPAPSRTNFGIAITAPKRLRPVVQLPAAACGPGRGMMRHPRVMRWSVRGVVAKR